MSSGINKVPPHLGHWGWRWWSAWLWFVIVSFAADNVGWIVARRGGRVEHLANRAALVPRGDPVQASVKLPAVRWVRKSNVNLRWEGSEENVVKRKMFRTPSLPPGQTKPLLSLGAVVFFSAGAVVARCSAGFFFFFLTL